MVISCHLSGFRYADGYTVLLVDFKRLFGVALELYLNAVCGDAFGLQGFGGRFGTLLGDAEVDVLVSGLHVGIAADDYLCLPVLVQVLRQFVNLLLFGRMTAEFRVKKMSLRRGSGTTFFSSTTTGLGSGFFSTTGAGWGSGS